MKKFKFLFLYIHINKSNKMNKSEESRILRWVKKLKSLEFLNSFKCKCGEDNVVKLCFHHKDDESKEDKISQLRNFNFERIKKELIKCEVICQNCHQELHQSFDIQKSSKFKKQNKVFFMQFLEKSCCEICGYNKCLDCLDFHHTEPHNKTIEFRIYRNTINDISDISEHIKNELNTCKVICRNCHMDEHHGKFFKDNTEIIYNKLKAFKGIQSKLPVDIVMKMYNDGNRQIDIARFFKASKSTISGIVKKNKDIK